MTELTADDTYLYCGNKQEVGEVQQKVVRMSHIEFSNLPNNTLLVPGKLYVLTSNIDVNGSLVDGAVGTLRTGIAGCLCYPLPQTSQ